MRGQFFVQHREIRTHEMAGIEIFVDQFAKGSLESSCEESIEAHMLG